MLVMAAKRNDQKLNFGKKLDLKDPEDFCKKAHQKIHALTTIHPYITLLKNHIDLKLFFNSQFDHQSSVLMRCPLTFYNYIKLVWRSLKGLLCFSVQWLPIYTSATNTFQSHVLSNLFREKIKPDCVCVQRKKL